MRLVLTTVVLAILTGTDARGQTYSYDQILSRADSLLRTVVKSHLLKHFHRDSATINYYYRLPNKRKYLDRADQIGKGERTKGHFQRALIFYHFTFREPMVNAVLHKGYLYYSIDISFDSQLRPSFLDDFPSDPPERNAQVDMSFIPKYVDEGRPCDFITMETALEIGKKANIETGFEPPSATLDYDNGSFKRYCWWITSPLTKEYHDNHIHGTADTVTIDAVTGDVLTHESTTYGALH
jgi:hypothetical protein